MTAAKLQPNNGSYKVEVQRFSWQGQTFVSMLAQVCKLNPLEYNIILIYLRSS